jgi:CRP/FNR family cyclic AMP-dependent transcriptional regulator
VEWPLLSLVPEEDRRRFLSVARRRRFEKGEVVFHGGDPGDTLHFVASGRFSVRVETSLGVTAMLALIGPGDYFGILALLDGTKPQRSAGIVALERAETLSVRKEEFEELRHRFPAVNEMLLRALGEQVRRLSDSLVEAMYTPVETRVLRRLLDAANVWDGPVPGSVVPLNQEDLAELAGTTRPTTNKVLRQAEERGWIRVRRGRVELVDPEALGKRAGKE